ncbi:hypothetical protein DERP_009944 [Dermatophagoides pteronyssinus]|uniref:Uncharacterized protein n=1 Tax=Dermatophagoides pteronyssinus TaxID=6956 RepID=A0ABQ8J230_DERPT|nr:hypothetical protein DERP_009944 [Dermatophagoides pteronyssinus]
MKQFNIILIIGIVLMIVTTEFVNCGLFNRRYGRNAIDDDDDQSLSRNERYAPDPCLLRDRRYAPDPWLFRNKRYSGNRLLRRGRNAYDDSQPFFQW